MEKNLTILEKVNPSLQDTHDNQNACPKSLLISGGTWIKYFKNIGNYSLEKLLYASPNSADGEERTRFELMQKVFVDTASPLNEPLFDVERDPFNIELDVNRHRSELRDPPFGDEKIFTAVMAYPPRPLISEDGQLTTKELDDWIANTDSNQIAADNPFIPLCCS
jgi:hypothetical protein